MLFYLEYLVGRGEIQAALRLLENLDREVIEPFVIVNRAIGEFASRVPGDVPVIDLAIGKHKPSRHLLQLRREIRRVRPDVCVGVSISPSRLLAAVSLITPGIKIVALETLFRMEAEKGHFSARRKLTALLHRRVSATVVGSDVAAADLEKHLRIASSEIEVIPYPVVDPSIFEAARDEPDVSLPGEEPLILNIGGLFENKGHVTLIRAVALVNRARPVRLAVIGTGPERAALEATTHELGFDGRMTFLGHRDNPYAYLSRADLYVSPSRGEGFDIAHIEALALGVPVVITDAPRFHVIEHNKSGLVVPVDDPQAMAAAILRVLESAKLREQLSQAGPLAVAHVASDQIARRWEELLLTVGRTP